MKKRILTSVMAGAMIFTLAACGSDTSSASLTDGTYSGEGVGMGGEDNPVKTTITIKDGKITEVTIEGEGETEGIGTNAIEQMPDMIIEANGVDVDTVSGATVTSEAILTGLADALSQAGA